MDSANNLLGCFASGPSVKWDDDSKKRDAALQAGNLFRTYIWGAGGICNTLKELIPSEYGEDLILILFEFYLNPIPEELAHLKGMGNYRKNERSIGVPIIVNDDNFFNKTDSERRLFLRNEILEKVSLLEAVVKKKKLDTDIGKLRKDLTRMLF